MKLRLYYPIKPWTVFQRFGECQPSICDVYHNLGLEGHNGQDIVASTGTIIRAAHDGAVVFAGEDGSAGYGIVIRTNERYDYKDGAAFYKTIYWHLLPSGIRVHAGQQVKAGDVIALSDNTGLSTGPHLHFGLKPVYPGENDWTWWNAEQDNGYKGAVDPASFFAGIFAEDVVSLIQKYNLLIAALQKILDLLKIKRSA